MIHAGAKKMLAWLVALPCLISASVNSTPSQSNAQVRPSNSSSLTIRSSLGFAALFQSSFVSKDLRNLAYQILLPLYGAEHNGRIYLSYTKIAHEFGRLVRDAAESNAGDVDKASEALHSSLDYMCIKSMLEVEFGYCIKYAKGKLPKLALPEFVLDTLNNERRISMLPFALDQGYRMLAHRWVHFVRGLAERGRFDLLSQITFSGITATFFAELMSVPLPESVVITAAEALQKNEPTSTLAKLLASAGFGDQAPPVPENCEVPLFLLGRLHEQNVLIPETCVFTDGLKESSIAFWMSVFGKEPNEAKELLALVLKHGDDKSKRLAQAFDTAVSDNGLSLLEADVFQGMLIRLRFSRICDGLVIQNYDAMLKGLVETKYHTVCALLDCEQLQPIIRQCFREIFNPNLEALIDKMLRIKDNRLHEFVHHCVLNWKDSPELLKSLILREAAESHVQLAWKGIQSSRKISKLDACSCSGSLSALRRIAFNPSVSLGDVEYMHSQTDEDWNCTRAIKRNKQVIHTLVFWKAPESVMELFLKQAANDYELDYKFVLTLLRSTKYSAGFCMKLIRRSGQTQEYIWEKLGQLRPELTKEQL